MFKLIKRLFGLDYNDAPVDAPAATIEDAVASVPNTEVTAVPAEVAKPVKEKKPRKPAAKKAAPKASKKK